MFLIKKWGILIKKESESLIFTGLKIPRDYKEVVGGKISVLPRETLLTYQRDKFLKGMVEKGLERESDDVIVGES